MLKSMTAYGRAAFHSEKGHFVAEIQSVNRKFLDISIVLPKEFLRFEIEIKKWIVPYVNRGQIALKIFVAFEKTVPFIVRPNFPLANQLKNAWRELAQEMEMDDAQVNLSLLAKQDDILIFEEDLLEEESYKESLKQVVEEALSGFLKMKNQEGAVLQADILIRIHKMREWIAIIEIKGFQATKKYREKLAGRLEEILPGKIENEERILREVAVFAEKIDISEEITRFIAHLTHFEEMLESENSQIGKTLEFMVQELNREINTIGSKSSDMDISRVVIDIKTELERIREQIQNIE